MTPMATKISYSNSAKAPKYGVVAAPAAKTYATLAQPASAPINPLYRAMAATTADQGTTAATPSTQALQAIFNSNHPTTPTTPAPTAASVAAAAKDNGGGTTTTPDTSGAGSTFDLSSDPVLAQIKTLADKSVADAQTGALDAKKQALIRFGDPTLATSLLGDTNTAAAAGQNPDSTLAQLLFQHQQQDQGIDQASNANNTFYGSAHANQLGDEAKNYELNRANAQNALYDLLTQADQGVSAAEQNAQGQYIAALPDAYSRAIAQPGAAGDGGAAPDTSGSEQDSGLTGLTHPLSTTGATAGISPALAALIQASQNAQRATPRIGRIAN